MANIITRRSILGAGVGMAALATGGEALAQGLVRGDASVAAPRLAIENGATLRILRPVRFVQPDEDVFRASAARFTQQTGVQVRVDFVGWEDINQQTAVTLIPALARIASSASMNHRISMQISWWKLPILLNTSAKNMAVGCLLAKSLANATARIIGSAYPLAGPPAHLYGANPQSGKWVMIQRLPTCRASLKCASGCAEPTSLLASPLAMRWAMAMASPIG